MHITLKLIWKLSLKNKTNQSITINDKKVTFYGRSRKICFLIIANVFYIISMDRHYFWYVHKKGLIFQFWSHGLWPYKRYLSCNHVVSLHLFSSAKVVHTVVTVWQQVWFVFLMHAVWKWDSNLKPLSLKRNTNEERTCKCFFTNYVVVGLIPFKWLWHILFFN